MGAFTAQNWREDCSWKDKINGENFHFYFDSDQIKIMKGRQGKCAMFHTDDYFLCFSGGIAISNCRQDDDSFVVCK